MISAGNSTVQAGSGASGLATAVALGVGLWAGAASAETREVVDVSVGAKASTSPFLVSGADTEAAAASLAIDPAIYIDDEITSLQLVGHVRLDQYFDRYGTDEVFRLGAAGRTLLSERTTLSGGADVSSSRAGAQDLLPIPSADPTGVPQPTFPDVQLPDLTGAGQGRRINNYSARASLDHVLSSTSTIGFGVNGNHSDTRGPLGQDYSQIGLNVNYSRQLTERAALLTTMQAASADYAGGRVGDGSFLTPMVGVQYSLDEKTSLRAQAGATFTRFAGVLDTTDEHVALAFSVNACKQQVRSSICADASRNSQPTAFGGVSTVTSLSATYALQTGMNDRLSLSGRYGRTNSIAATDILGRGNFEVLAATANYSHEIGRRLFVYAAPAISTYSSSNQPQSETNVQIEIGIRRRFGDLR